MSDQTVFVSDLHLSPSLPGTTDLFLGFLAGPARQSAELFILGDLFEYWAGDDHLADPFNARVCAAIKAVADAGVRIGFIAGNRDFLVGERFAEAAGLTRLTDPTLGRICGEPTLLLHGDILCTDDTDYQQFRAMVRAPAWQADFLARPLAERIAVIEGLRARSKAEKFLRSMELMDVNPAAVAAAFREHGCTRMIHGHTHRLARHEHVVAGTTCRRWVLGQWQERGNALVCTSDGWDLKSWDGRSLS